MPRKKYESSIQFDLLIDIADAYEFNDTAMLMRKAKRVHDYLSGIRKKYFQKKKEDDTYENDC